LVVTQRKKIKNAKLSTARGQDAKDAFAVVAARLECDPDLKAFDAKLGKIAKVKPQKLR
jgi:hypothetical protein